MKQVVVAKIDGCYIPYLIDSVGVSVMIIVETFFWVTVGFVGEIEILSSASNSVSKMAVVSNLVYFL